MTYRVIITPTTEAMILAQARYIAVDCQAPLNAARWLEKMFDAADTLDQYPRRCSLALENEHRPYEIRNLNVVGYLLLFTIVEETKTVWVIGFRHGQQQEISDELPDDPSAMSDDESDG